VGFFRDREGGFCRGVWVERGIHEQGRQQRVVESADALHAPGVAWTQGWGESLRFRGL
jgi:hypothetical protein